MNIEDLTIKQARELASLFGSAVKSESSGLNCMIGQKVIVRTYSAGNWFGLLEQKSGNEVILQNARRMWYWKAAEGISLSACALYGVDKSSKIIEPVAHIWLEAIEIIPCSADAIKSIEDAKNVKAK